MRVHIINDKKTSHHRRKSTERDFPIHDYGRDLCGILSQFVWR